LLMSGWIRKNKIIKVLVHRLCSSCHAKFLHTFAISQKSKAPKARIAGRQA
jgi:hypothetical protein